MQHKNPYKLLYDELQPRVDREKLESPLEEIFIDTFEKYISNKSLIFPQYEIMTLAGKFRVDFLITVGERKIAFECDGKGFHDEWRDEWRDGLILGSTDIDTIYRFRGKDLYTFMNDCIYLIFYYDKELFNERYSLMAPQLISKNIKNQYFDEPFSFRERNYIEYETLSSEGEQIGALEVVVDRRNKYKGGHWMILFQVAKDNPGRRLDELMEIRRHSYC